MIQRISGIMNNSVRLKAFIRVCKDYIISVKFFIFCGLGILYAILSFIRYVLLLNNSCSWLTYIVTNFCGITIYAIFLVSVWIILELLALIIETKRPLSNCEIEAKCIDADLRCFPRDQRLKSNQPVSAKEIQKLQASLRNERTNDELKANLNTKGCFVLACIESRSRSPHDKPKFNNKLQTEIDRPSTCVQPPQSSEMKESTLNFIQRQEERKLLSSFAAPTALNEQQPPNIRPTDELNANSGLSLLGSTENIPQLSQKKNQFYGTKHSAPELVSLFCKNQSHKRKYNDESNMNTTGIENRGYKRKNEMRFIVDHTDLKTEMTSLKSKLSSKSNLKVDESADDSSTEMTATASEGDSSWTDDSPTKILPKSFHGNSESSFSNKSCTMQSRLDSNIKNDDLLESDAVFKEKQNSREHEKANSEINITGSNIKANDSTKSTRTDVLTRSIETGTPFEVERASATNTNVKKSFSCNEVSPSEAIQNNELKIKNSYVLTTTTRPRESLNPGVRRNFCSGTKGTSLASKVIKSTKDSTTAGSNRNIKIEINFDAETMNATPTETEASSFSCNNTVELKNKSTITLFPRHIPTSLNTTPTISSSMVEKSSSPDITESPSPVSKLEALMDKLNSKPLTKLAEMDSKTQMMSAKFKRSLSTPLGEAQNVSSLKRKYESSSSDSGSENSWNAASNKRKAKRRTKSCSIGNKVTFIQGNAENGKEQKL